MYNVNELLKKAVGILRESDTDTPVLDAELILLHVMDTAGQKTDRLKLVTRPDMAVGERIEAKYFELVNERSKGKPVQYITGRQEFMGFEMYISEGVLIPRPDTETVAERAIELAKEMEKPVIIDMCTGSGGIAISLAAAIPGSKVWAVDFSDSALECCRINVNRFKLENNIRVTKSDLFAGIMDEELIENTDIIVSNPPYIESGSIPELSINVRGYEPHSALDGGKDGLEFYRRITRDSVGFLKTNGILMFETGYDQGTKVRNIMEGNSCYHDINIEKDLAGYDRCIWGRKARI